MVFNDILVMKRYKKGLNVIVQAKNYLNCVTKQTILM